MTGYRGASLGFPPAFEAESEAPLLPEIRLPYATEEIETYLHQNHYHLLLEELPIKFAFAGIVTEREIGGRRYWAVQCRDESDRVWFVLVGSGRSALKWDRWMRRWMLAMLPDGSLSLVEMFEAEIENQLEHDRRQAATEHDKSEI